MDANNLNEVEQNMVERTDRSQYDIYRCPEHGLYTILKSNEVTTCPYNCGKGGIKYEE